VAPPGDKKVERTCTATNLSNDVNNCFEIQTA